MVSTKKINIPITEKLYLRLQEEVNREQSTLTAFAREAIEDLLKRRERERRKREVAEFAQKYSGTEFDLLPDVEEVGSEFLSGNTKGEDD